MPIIQIMDVNWMPTWAKVVIAICYLGIALVLVIPFFIDFIKGKNK